MGFMLHKIVIIHSVDGKIARGQFTFWLDLSFGKI